MSEWFEYNGEPYHFKLLIDSTYDGVNPEKHQRVLDRVEYYKNLRSVLDEIEYYDMSGGAVQYVGAAFLGSEMIDGATAVMY